MADLFLYRTSQAYSIDVKKYVNVDLDEFEIIMRYLRTERKNDSGNINDKINNNNNNSIIIVFLWIVITNKCFFEICYIILYYIVL